MSTVSVAGLIMDGHPWRVTRTDLLNGVGVRTPSGERVGTDGEWAGTTFRSARSGVLEGLCKASDRIALDAAQDELDATIALDDFPVTFHLPAGPRTVFVRRSGEVLWDWLGGNTAKWSASLKAHDPYVYLGDGVRPSWSGTTGRAFETGGVGFPLGFPLGFDATVSGGQLLYRNPGTTGKLEIRFDGPLTDPTVTTVNADGTRTLAWSLTVPDGAFLLVDPRRREALLQGQSSRPPVIRQWPRLTAGDNQFRFHAAGASTGTVTVHAYAAR